MTQPIIVHTGEKAPESGIYRYIGRETEAALSKDDRIPPNTQNHRQAMVLVRRTHGGN